MSTRSRMAIVALTAAVLLGCSSPEANRVRGGGPGADVGNRSRGVVQLHAGSNIYHRTPTEGRGLGRAGTASGG
jgi:hypothetical protein